MSAHPTRLTILGKGSKAGYVRCRCSCGAEKEIRAAHIRAGKIRSCGCLSQELSSRRRTTHGRCGTPEYRCWQSMINRCHNSGAADYPRYGELPLGYTERAGPEQKE